MSDETPEIDSAPNIAIRVAVIEKRLGIDPVAVLADEAASLEAGAAAHEGNSQSDVAPPAEAQSAESALENAEAADTPHDALSHIDAALAKWPDDSDLQAAKADLEKEIAEQTEPAEEPTQS